MTMDRGIEKLAEVGISIELQRMLDHVEVSEVDVLAEALALLVYVDTDTRLACLLIGMAINRNQKFTSKLKRGLRPGVWNAHVEAAERLANYWLGKTQ